MSTPQTLGEVKQQRKIDGYPLDGSPTDVIDGAAQPLRYVDPQTGLPLVERDGRLVRDSDGTPVAPCVGKVADFVGGETYAQSFSFQWTKTKIPRMLDPKLMRLHAEELDLRTRFHDRDLTGYRSLEVGAGLGFDTTYLLGRGVSEHHATDLSASIFRAAELIDDPRVRFARADVNALPFEPESFDLVFCHRMIQHTPHPAATLARVARMVRPGGLLFIHSYHKSKYFSRASKYKYRPITTRVPDRLLWSAIMGSSWLMRGATRTVSRMKAINGEELARRWSPWVLQGDHMISGLDAKTVRRLEAEITFDALTPTYDLPMYSKDFRDLIESMGFAIEHIEDRPWFPLWALATKSRGHSSRGR